jgi:valyl-tRNA synthetase
VHPEDERYKDLIGKNCMLPIAGRLIPIVGDEYSDPEKGSGAVKITPAHDFNDFEVGQRHNLERINIFDADAVLNENTPAAYQGLDRFEARKKIIAEMDSLGLLEKQEDNEMSVPYGDRSGVVIEPWLTDQWFADAAKLAGPAIEAVESGRTKFVPAHWQNTYFEWMRNIQPWCISRQIWWGHQIPSWFGPDGEIFVEMTEAEALAAAEVHYGKAVELKRDDDVLDTWFSSALWPFSTLGWPQQTPELDKYYPTDVLVTGFDIIFFWVARMMMMGLHFMDEVPFHTVYIHALVRDEKGQKMSKSKGNIIDPLELIEKFGTDALRMTLAAHAAQGRDIKLSENRVEGYRNFTTKLWNAARYCEMNECKPDPAFDPTSPAGSVNRWIIGKLAEAADAVAAGIESYRFNEAAGAIYQFTWGTFCDWYIEFTKPMLQGEDQAAMAETRATAGWVLDQLLLLLHPFMPFITEELWAEMADTRDQSLINSPWPRHTGLGNADAAAEIDWVVRAVSQIRSVRAEMNVPPRAEIPLFLGNPDALATRAADAHGAMIKRLARISELAPLAGEVPEGSVQDVLGETSLILPLAGVIDFEQERARLGKEAGKLQAEIKKFDAKLGNQGFLAKAPEAVIAEQRERREETAVLLGKLEDAVARLPRQG